MAKKSHGAESKLAYHGHVLMENRNGLVVGSRLTRCSGTAEPDTAVELVGQLPGSWRITVGLDKGYDYPRCVQGLRALKATAHVAQRAMCSAVDDRTVCHAGYWVSQRIRKRVEEIFGWTKTVGVYRKTRFRGLERVQWGFTLTMTAYNLIRMSNLLARGVES